MTATDSTAGGLQAAWAQAQQDMEETDARRASPAGREGIADATRLVTAAHAAGIRLEAIDVELGDHATAIARDAHTDYGRLYASEFGDTVQVLVAELRGIEEDGRRPDPGTPHPDPFLARRGWATGPSGVYRRDRTARLSATETDKEAG
jgi:hypothetical protein